MIFSLFSMFRLNLFNIIFIFSTLSVKIFSYLMVIFSLFKSLHSFRTTLQNYYSSLLWLYFWGFHIIIPLGHKWKVWCQKRSPLALKLLPKQNLDPEVENEPISRFCYLKMGDFRLPRAVKIKPRHVER